MCISVFISVYIYRKIFTIKLQSDAAEAPHELLACGLGNQLQEPAVEKACCPMIETYPKHSPDLNAIEGVWALLRQRLTSTEPEEVETRERFLQRLRRCEARLNTHHREAMLTMCTTQKQRAAEVLKLRGARCSYYDCAGKLFRCAGWKNTARAYFCHIGYRI